VGEGGKPKSKSNQGGEKKGANQGHVWGLEEILRTYNQNIGGGGLKRK